MSGIAGLWNRDGRPVDRDTLAGMSGTLSHRGPDGEGLWVDGPVGLGCQLNRISPESVTETQPLAHPSGVVLVFDGRLDNRDEILAASRDSSPVVVDSPDPDLVLAAYHQWGEEFAGRLTGDFAFALWDPGRHRLLLVRDAIGVTPLYYCQAGASFLFASEIKALLAHPDFVARPDENHLAELLLDAYPQDDRGLTFFEGVSSVPPAHVVSITAGSVTARQYWDFPEQAVHLGPFSDYVAEFRHLLEQAVGRRLRSTHPVAVLVSGGVDSSSLFCLANTLVRRGSAGFPMVQGITSTVRDGSPADEGAFIDDIERHQGVSIHRVPLQPGFLEGSEQAVWHAENPRLDILWSMTGQLQSTARHLGCRVVLTGIGADETHSDPAYLVDLFRRLAWRKISAHLREMPGWYTDTVPEYFARQFRRELLRHHTPKAMMSLYRGIKARAGPAKGQDSWYTRAFREPVRPPRYPLECTGRFANVHARSVCTYLRSRIYRLKMDLRNKVGAMDGVLPSYPYLDREVLSFLTAIPGEMMTQNGVPKALLREAMRGTMPDSIVERRWKADFTQLAKRGVEQDWSRVVQYLQKHSSAATLGYVDIDALREVLPRHLTAVKAANVGAPVWRLAVLIGLELWLQTFFDEVREKR